MHIGTLGIYDGLSVRTALSVGLWKSISKKLQIVNITFKAGDWFNGKISMHQFQDR